MLSQNEVLYRYDKLLTILSFRLSKHDVVLTTYNIVGKEVGAPEGDKNGEEPVKDEDSEEKVTSSFLYWWGSLRAMFICQKKQKNIHSKCIVTEAVRSGPLLKSLMVSIDAAVLPRPFT